ncbi:LysM domain-containing protein, partial [Tolypocladium paradoxum]
MREGVLVGTPNACGQRSVNPCNLIVGNTYCVERNYGIPPETTVTSTAPTTTTGNGIATPTPTQAGMTPTETNGCAAIASNHGISLDSFYAWNPAVKADCSGLVYVCVGVIGQRQPQLAQRLPPRPRQRMSGMAPNCDAFHKVVPGDTCYDISNSAAVALAKFYAWNPAVGKDCSGLAWILCLHIVHMKAPHLRHRKVGRL